MLESIISFSSFNWISYSLQIISQISLDSSNVVFSIKIAGNLQKMCVNNWLFQFWILYEITRWSL